MPLNPQPFDFYGALTNLSQTFGDAAESRRKRGIEELRKQVFANGVLDPEVAVQKMLQFGDVEGASKAATIFKALQPERITPYQAESLDIQRQRLAQEGQKPPTVQTFFDEQGRSVRKVWRNGKWEQEGGAKSAPGTGNVSAMKQGGQQVLGMVDQLEGKVRGDKKRFEGATGPFVSDLSEAPVWRPDRLAYEATQSGQNKAYLDQIKQDAQAINTVMQRNLLKGGGAITESERAQINKILGGIAAARSAEDAQALLTNFRGLVRKIFLMDEPEGTALAAPSGQVTAPSGSGEFQEGDIAENPETGETIIFRGGQWELE